MSATEPAPGGPRVTAVMSVPRLGFMDAQFVALDALPGLVTGIRTGMGAYWQQAIEKAIEQAIERDGADLVLTIDYDSLFTRADVAALIELMVAAPWVDALAPLQASRDGRGLPLYSIDGPDGAPLAEIPAERFSGELARVSTAHFGLTLIRAAALRALPKPWFHAVPAADGSWGEGHVDADTQFWKKWAAAGRSLYLAPRVVIGHLALTALWPGRDLGTIVQPIAEWRAIGKPAGAWA